MSQPAAAADLADLPGWLTDLAVALPGVRGETLSRFLPPADGSGRRSGVLILLADVAAVQPERAASRPAVLLETRATTLRSHAGQVAFPGGAVDAGDPDPAFTALREAREEVGLDPTSVRVLGALPDLFLSASDYVVTPVVGWWRRPHPVGAVDVAEVARVSSVAVDDLAAPANRFRVRHPSGYVGPGFDAAGLFVWGFTAGLLDGVLRLAGWERPWERGRFRELPADVGDRPLPPG